MDQKWKKCRVKECKLMSKKFTCLDLFSGAGGLSRGFLDAGYDVVLGSMLMMLHYKHLKQITENPNQ